MDQTAEHQESRDSENHAPEWTEIMLGLIEEASAERAELGAKLIRKLTKRATRRAA
jgi:hypothetical protein